MKSRAHNKNKNRSRELKRAFKRNQVRGKGTRKPPSRKLNATISCDDCESTFLPAPKREKITLNDEVLWRHFIKCTRCQKEYEYLLITPKGLEIQKQLSDLRKDKSRKYQPATLDVIEGLSVSDYDTEYVELLKAYGKEIRIREDT